MSYLVLARKWRPQTFEDVVGQQPIVRTLQNAIERNRVPHAIIFSGVRGVGKTTLARIMAKALNCKEGPARVPCNSCEACREITAGSAVDLHEIDGASNRGIQEIRELKENIRFFPARDRYKIMIIDEVHMLTTEAFNALLKTLEEPPEHVYFMFATTELHKIPITILSRCQRYELKRVSAKELGAYFRMIAGEEGISISDWALNMIVREAEGSVRDGLSLLDQIFSFGGEKIEDDDLVQVLGLVDRQVLKTLAAAIMSGDLAASMELLDETYAYGVDLKRFSNDLLSYFRALIVCKVSAQPEKLLEVSDQDLAELKEAAAACSIETLHSYFSLLLKSVEEMRYSSHPRLVLEMAFLRAAQAGNIVPVSELLAKVDALLQGGGSEEERQPVRHERSTPAAGPEKPASAFPAIETAEPELPTVASRKPAGKALEKVPKKKAEPEAAAPDTETEAAAAAAKIDTDEKPAGQKDLRKHWDEFIAYVMDRKKWMALVLQMSAGVREDGNRLVIKYDNPADCKILQSKENMKYLAEFIQDFFQHEIEVKIKIRGAELNGVHGGENGSPQEERRALANDPLVQTAIEVFDGNLVNIRTGSRSR